MKEDYCFWTVAPNSQAKNAEALIASARSVGVFKSFHVWTDGVIDGAVIHPLRASQDAADSLYRLSCLRDGPGTFECTYSVWLEPTARFRMDPGSLLRALKGAPLHVPLTFDLSAPEIRDRQWGGTTCGIAAQLFESSGINNRCVFAAHSGFLIAHREVVSTALGLAFDLWERAKARSVALTVEPLLAYVCQMLAGDARRHHVSVCPDIWLAKSMLPRAPTAPAIVDEGD